MHLYALSETLSESPESPERPELRTLSESPERESSALKSTSSHGTAHTDDSGSNYTFDRIWY